MTKYASNTIEYYEYEYDDDMERHRLDMMGKGYTLFSSEGLYARFIKREETLKGVCLDI